MKPYRGRIQLITSYKLFITPGDGNQIEIGAVQKINTDEDRDVKPSFEIGTAMGEKVGEPFELSAGVITSKRITVERIRLISKNLIQAIGAGATAESIYENDIPFDIVKEITVPVLDSKGYPTSATTTKVLKTYKDCLIKSLGTIVDITGDIREIENATIECRTIITPKS